MNFNRWAKTIWGLESLKKRLQVRNGLDKKFVWKCETGYGADVDKWNRSRTNNLQKF